MVNPTDKQFELRWDVTQSCTRRIKLLRTLSFIPSLIYLNSKRVFIARVIKDICIRTSHAVTNQVFAHTPGDVYIRLRNIKRNGPWLLDHYTDDFQREIPLFPCNRRSLLDIYSFILFKIFLSFSFQYFTRRIEKQIETFGICTEESTGIFCAWIGREESGEQGKGHYYT